MQVNTKILIVPACLFALALSACHGDSSSGFVDAQPAPAQHAASPSAAAETRTETAKIAPETAHPAATSDSKPDSKPVAPATTPKVADGAKAELGKMAPDFTLTDLDGKTHTLSESRGKIVVLEWFNPDCPYCDWGYTQGPLKEQPERVTAQGVVWLSVNSTDPKMRGGTVDRNREFVKAKSMRAPILMDTTGAVGKSYGAKSTPHCFVINEKGVLVYRGGLDNAPQGQVEPGAAKTNFVDAAIADLRSGHAVTAPDTRSYG